MNATDVSEAHAQASSGVGADTLLKLMEPMINERLKRLLDTFATIVPELPVMLDLRAKLIEVRRIQKELERVRSTGADAAKALREIAG